MIWLQTILGLKHSAAHRSECEWLLNRSTFQTFLERERMRADRNQGVFSLLVISLRPTNSPQAARELVSVLQGRIRRTDIAGWFDGRRVGVILPDTGASGAYKLASDLSDYFDDPRTTPDFDIYTHPADEATGKTIEDSPAQEVALVDAPQSAGGGSEERRSRGERRQGTMKCERIDIAETTSFAQATQVRAIESLLLQRQPIWKRSLDIIGAVLGLVLLSPLLLITALVIKRGSPGPVIFAQQREGLGGRVFTMYKFRTMCIDADAMKARLRTLSEQDGPAFKLTNDPRVTPLGRFLRRTCIDELPQLWNVLRGEMSLVGPRPLPVDESRKCKPWQRRRLAVKPGLTCIWQVEGGIDVTFDEWMRMDLQYAASRSPSKDARLLWKTFTKVLLRRASR